MAASEIPTLSHLGSVPQSLFSGTVAILTIAWFSVVLRVYVRSVMMRSFGWDDWTIMLAIAAFTVQCAYIIKAAQMEMQPTKYNNVAGLSELVTVCDRSNPNHADTDLNSTGHHCLQWILRNHRCLLENLVGSLFPTHHCRTVATYGHLHLHGHQHHLWLHLLRHRHIWLWRPSEVPSTDG